MKSREQGKYKVFERKLFFQMVFMSAAAIVGVLVLRSMVRGWFGNFTVLLIELILGYDHHDALYFYQYAIRSNTTMIIIAAVLIIIMLSFRVFIRWLTKYFDEINDGLDTLISSNQDNISLSSEMHGMEVKMNECKWILQEREKEARQAEKRKNDLVVYLAHDIKTPLTSVIGYLELMSEYPDMKIEQRIKYVDLTLEKANRLEEMLEEFFEVAKYNIQGMQIEYQECNLTYMLRQMAEEFYPILRKKNQEIDISGEDECIVQGDPNRLARVFNNILKNAAAYGAENSKIEIIIEPRHDLVRLAFKNKGEDIPKYKLEKLFERFYRVDESRATDTGNAGLGLAIAKEIVLLHHGNIYADSSNGFILFTVELPYTGRA